MDFTTTIDAMAAKLTQGISAHLRHAAGERVDHIPNAQDMAREALATALAHGEIVPATQRATPRSELRRIAFTDGTCPICGTLLEDEDPEDSLER